MEQQVLELLKEKRTLKHMLNILEKVEISIEGTEFFTYIAWNTTWCNIILICYDLESQNILEKNKERIEEALLEIDFGNNCRNAKYHPRLIIKRGIGTLKPKTKLDVSFEKIETKIIENLEEANFFIWVAVAWITNQKIINVLNEKAKKGINIQVIMMNDHINNKKNYFNENYNLQIFKKDTFGYYGENLMHNKFCIIDGKIVLTGSYNWSSKAEYNKENIVEFSNEKVENYMHEFIKLKNIL